MRWHLSLMRSLRYEIILDLSRIVIVILLYLAQDCAREDYGLAGALPCVAAAPLSRAAAALAQTGRCRTGSDGPVPRWLRRAAAALAQTGRCRRRATAVLAQTGRCRRRAAVSE